MRDRRLFMVAIGITQLAVLVLSQVTVAPAAFAKGGPPAKITWSQRVVTGTVTAGGTVTATVTFTSTKDLSNVTIRLTPSLKGTTVVSPTTFVSITAGVPYTVEVTFTAPANGKRPVYNGVLTIRERNRALAKPLPLRFKVQP